MPRKGIEETDVRNAIKQIQGEGKQPTVRLVRAVLGTGSTAKISALLAKIRAEKEPGDTLASLPPPEALLKLATQYAEAVWKASVEAASEENRELRQLFHQLAYSFAPIAEQMEAISKRVNAHCEQLHAAGDNKDCIMEEHDDLDRA